MLYQDPGLAAGAGSATEEPRVYYGRCFPTESDLLRQTVFSPLGIGSTILMVLSCDGIDLNGLDNTCIPVQPNRFAKGGVRNSKNSYSLSVVAGEAVLSAE